LNAKRLYELGVPPGPIYSSIKEQEGDEITLPNGKIVSRKTKCFCVANRFKILVTG